MTIIEQLAFGNPIPPTGRLAGSDLRFTFEKKHANDPVPYHQQGDADLHRTLPSAQRAALRDGYRTTVGALHRKAMDEQEALRRAQGRLGELEADLDGAATRIASVDIEPLRLQVAGQAYCRWALLRMLNFSSSSCSSNSSSTCSCSSSRPASLNSDWAVRPRWAA